MSMLNYVQTATHCVQQHTPCCMSSTTTQAWRVVRSFMQLSVARRNRTHEEGEVRAAMAAEVRKVQAEVEWLRGDNADLNKKMQVRRCTGSGFRVLGLEVCFAGALRTGNGLVVVGCSRGWGQVKQLCCRVPCRELVLAHGVTSFGAGALHVSIMFGVLCKHHSTAVHGGMQGW